MKVIIDAMGGDFAPQVTVEGALQAVKEYGTEVILVGRAEKILTCLEEMGIKDLPQGIEIVHAEEVVEAEDNPATVAREKKNSSMAMGLGLLKEDRAAAFISAGNTGALLTSATLIIKRVRGIRRAALAPMIPSGTGGAILMDAGATAECTPEYLLQYAYMGVFFAQRVLDRPNPKVGLLNIGAEPGKGTEMHRETFQLLKQADAAGRLNFLGNVEAKEAILGGVDVVVTDGFSGNIMLKAFEGTAKLMNEHIKKLFTKGVGSKVAAGLVMGGINEMRREFDPNETGGTMLLGIAKPVIKAHGSSNAFAIKNAVRQAMLVANSGVIEDIKENVEFMKLDTTGE